MWVGVVAIVIFSGLLWLSARAGRADRNPRADVTRPLAR